MWTPMEPDLGRGDDGIPAADPGPGAPPTADGFQVIDVWESREAQERIDFGDTAGDWQTPAPSGADGDAVQDPEELPDSGATDPQETPAETERGSAAAVIILAAAAAAALGVVLALRRRRDRTR